MLFFHHYHPIVVQVTKLSEAFKKKNYLSHLSVLFALKYVTHSSIFFFFFWAAGGEIHLQRAFIALYCIPQIFFFFGVEKKKLFMHKMRIHLSIPPFFFSLSLLVFPIFFFSLSPSRKTTSFIFIRTK